MSGSVFYLKYRDTLPVLEVALLNPDGSPYDLTDADSAWLNIKLSDGTVLAPRQMEIVAPPTSGVVRYAWLAIDWAADALVPGPTLPLQVGQAEHQMEYEVVDGVNRQTFPNDGNDILRIVQDIE